MKISLHFLASCSNSQLAWVATEIIYFSGHPESKSGFFYAFWNNEYINPLTITILVLTTVSYPIDRQGPKDSSLVFVRSVETLQVVIVGLKMSQNISFNLLNLQLCFIHTSIIKQEIMISEFWLYIFSFCRYVT